MQTFDGNLPKEAEEEKKLEKLIPMFRMEEERLFSNGRLCVPGNSVSKLLGIAQDSRIGGHFQFPKTISKLRNIHWRHKARDVKRYVDVGFKCQQYKDFNKCRLADPEPLEKTERRSGSLSTDFIVNLPKNRNGYDSVTRWVNRIFRNVHFIKSKRTDTPVNVTNSFFKTYSSIIDCWIALRRTMIASSGPSFGRG